MTIFSEINKEIEEVLLDYLKTFDATPEVEGKIKLENGLVKVRWNKEIEGEQGKALDHISQLANLISPLRGIVYVSQSKFTTYKSNNNGDNAQQHNQQQPRQMDGQDFDTDFPIYS